MKENCTLVLFYKINNITRKKNQLQKRSKKIIYLSNHLSNVLKRTIHQTPEKKVNDFEHFTYIQLILYNLVTNTFQIPKTSKVWMELLEFKIF